MALSSRENILSKIRQALRKPVEVPFADRGYSEFVYQPSTQDLELEFDEMIGLGSNSALGIISSPIKTLIDEKF